MDISLSINVRSRNYLNDLCLHTYWVSRVFVPPGQATGQIDSWDQNPTIDKNCLPSVIAQWIDAPLLKMGSRVQSLLQQGWATSLLFIPVKRIQQMKG